LELKEELNKTHKGNISVMETSDKRFSSFDRMVNGNLEMTIEDDSQESEASE
jgi:hypothetical protein